MDTLGNRPWYSWPFAPIVTSILCFLFYVPLIVRHKINQFSRLSFLYIFLFYSAQAFVLYFLSSTLFGVQPLSNGFVNNVIVTKDFIWNFGQFVTLMIIIWIVSFFATISSKILYLPKSKSLGSLLSAILNILMWVTIVFVLFLLIRPDPYDHGFYHDPNYGNAIYLK